MTSPCRPPVARVALAALLLTSACSLAPKFVAPPPAVPAAWPAGPAYAPNAAAQPGLPWRQVFTEPRLQAVIARALANNQNLAATVANVDGAYAQFRAQRSNLFPALVGSASGTFGASSGGNGVLRSGSGSAIGGSTGTSTNGGTSSSGGTGATTRTTGSTTTGSVQAGVGFGTFTIDLFGREHSLTRQAFERYLATDAGYRSARITLIGAVATAYATLASDRNLLEIAQQTAQSAGLTVKLLRLQLGAGLASRADVANAEAVYATARADIANQTTLIAQDRNLLELLVGGPVEDGELPAGLAELDKSVAITPAGLSSQVLLQRPDVRQAEFTLRSTNFEIGAARAAFFPDITLSALAGIASGGIASLFTNPTVGVTGTPGITVPILGGPQRANLALARADQRAAIATYRYTVQTAFQQVADGLARRGTLREQRAAQAENVAANSTAYQLLYQQFQVGLGTLLDALIAQRTLYTARQNEVAAVLTDVENRINLYQYIGADDGR